MVARKNIRNPELGDSIRKLINRTESLSTVPHGVKEAGPDEGTRYVAPDGGTLYLDGAKLLQWDIQISEAKQALEDAQLLVSETGSALDDVELRLNSLGTELDDFQAGNIDVTGTLAAKLVQAMDIQTKRLVVTEDAILQHVTAIEGIVTSDLVAERIVLSDLGYDLMQEAALTVTGPTGTVELTGSGYQAWNSQNELTVRLNGWDNLITGTLSTAPAGTRSVISTRNGISAMDFYADDSEAHAAIYFEKNATGATYNLGLFAMPDSGLNPDTATGIYMDQESRSLVILGDYMTFHSDVNFQENRVYFGYAGETAPYIEGLADGSLTLRSQTKDLNMMGNIALNGKLFGYGGYAPVMSARGMTFDDVAGFEPRVFAAQTLQIDTHRYLNLEGFLGARIKSDSEPFRLTGQNDAYPFTTSETANLYQSPTTGTLRRVTSSVRYKKFIGDWDFPVERLGQYRLRRWKDRVQPGVPEDKSWHYGATAEETYELFPEVVPTIPDPDGSGEEVPDGIAYDRLALAASVATYQNHEPRIAALEAALAAAGIPIPEEN